jgi:hypothetical protein
MRRAGQEVDQSFGMPKHPATLAAMTINVMAIAKFLIVLHALIPSLNERGRQFGGLLRRSTALNGHYDYRARDRRLLFWERPIPTLSDQGVSPSPGMEPQNARASWSFSSPV